MGPVKTKLQTAIERGTFVITAEIVPPVSGSASALLSEAAAIGGAVTAMNVTDAAAGKTTMSSFAAAALLAQHGYEPVLQVTCRDRNRIALAADLLGASAQGVHNVLVLRGDDPSGGDQPDAKPVHDLDSVALMTLVRDMRDEGVLPSGRRIDPPPCFFIGAADVARASSTGASQALHKKIAGGAQFVQTQFCFDLDAAGRYVAQLREQGVLDRLGVIIGVGPLRSGRSARWMNENLFGVHVPAAVIERLERSTDAAAEGRQMCVELIEGLRRIPGVAGVHLMAPGGGTDVIAGVLELVGGAPA